MTLPLLNNGKLNRAARPAPAITRASRPPPTHQGETLAEAIATIHSHHVPGPTGARTALVTTRPFRAPTRPFRTWG